jgi:oligopeptide/dipeptide ABC transporter ATP-binding protein
MSSPGPLLEVTSLSVETRRDHRPILQEVGVTLARRRTLGIVGESGCGKSTLALAIMGLLPPSLVTGGSVKLDGSELLGLSDRRLRAFRGARMAMIFQNPFASLNPSMRVGAQIAEMLEVHKGLDRGTARKQAVGLLEQVEIPRAAERAGSYPHEFSGGMQQRAMIAIAIACEPELLIADEPTTALDVTVQRQVLALLRRLTDERGMSLVIVSHDLAVVGQLADTVAVMYAGQIVEEAPAASVFETAQHPYTRALISSVPRVDDRTRGPLPTIPGRVEGARGLDACSFRPRCPFAVEICSAKRPLLVPTPETGGTAACWVLPWSGAARKATARQGEGG